MSTRYSDVAERVPAGLVPEGNEDERRERSDRSETERAVGTRPESARSGPPDPEVPAKATRRRFTAQYKLRILGRADTCNGAGELGALLRREGLYSSHLSAGRRQRDSGALRGLAPKKRGRKAKRRDPVAEENVKLKRDNERLRKRLRQAETIIGVQKKVCEMLGIPPAETPDGEDD